MQIIQSDFYPETLVPASNSLEDFSFLCPDHYFVSQNSLNSQESKTVVCLHQDFDCWISVGISSMLFFLEPRSNTSQQV